jgi:hypothetical protein
MVKYYSFNTKVLYICILFFTYIKVDAQVTTNDSMYFNTVFNGISYTADIDFPGSWYIHPVITNRAMLFDKLDNQFKYTNNDYYGSYKNMLVDSLKFVDSVNTTMNYYYNINPNYAYKQNNPVKALDFTLNGKKSEAYCVYFPSSSIINNECKKCFLIITGSGSYNGTAMTRGEGYQNQFGSLKDSLAVHGDVYIAIRPLLDFRSFRRRKTPTSNPKDLNSEFPIPSQITNYLNNRGTPYGTNSLIESIALTKYLKTKYRRVIISGLSFGGIYTTLNAFETSPDACLVSGGYTVEVDNTASSSVDYQSSHFGNLIFSLNRDTVKNKINILKNKTEFMFSWGQSGDIPQEAIYHSTENYFIGHTNTQYYYNYGPHTFPPQLAFRNLLDSINIKAKPVIKEISKSCNPINSSIKINICGIKPFLFDLYRNDSIYGSYVLNSDSIILNLTQEGNYQIRNLFDSLNRRGFNSDLYEFIPNNNININLVSSEYNCDSNKYLYKFHLEGNPYWNIAYTKNGLSESIVNLYSDTLKTFWDSGTYIINSIQDNGACNKVINDTIVLNTTLSLNDLFGDIKYNCDSNHVEFKLNKSFEKATKIMFSKNGLLDSISVENNSIKLTNGNYVFAKLVFANGCSKILNINYLVNENPLTLINNGSLFNCDSLKTNLSLSLTGKSPWSVFYNIDTIAYLKSSNNSTINLFLENGTTVITTIIDSNNCIINPFLIKNELDTIISFTLLSKTYNCDSNKTQFKFKLEGKAPWKFYFTKNGNADSILLNNQLPNLYFTNGSYSFTKIKDANNCEFIINQSFVLNEIPINYQLVSSNYNCILDSTQLLSIVSGKPPFNVNYYKNGLLNSNTFYDINQTWNLDNGVYFYSTISDSNNCVFEMNDFYTFSNTPLAAAITNNIYICDSNKAKINFTLQGNAPYNIAYTQNGQANTYTTSQATSSQYYNNGSYVFGTVTDATGCTATISNNANQAINYNVLNESHTAPLYDCNSNSSNITYTLTGNAPYTIYYTKDGVANTFIATTNTATQNISNGSYNLISITDATNCTKSINNAFVVNFTPLAAAITNNIYICDSNKAKINFTLQGNAPYNIAYTQNGQANTYTTSQATSSQYYSNGKYVFGTVTDATGCTTTISNNANQSINYNVLSESHTAPLYDCNSNSSNITYTLTGNAPYTIYYTKDGVANTFIATTNTAIQNITNGSYNLISISDATNCTKSINDAFVVNNTPLAAAITNNIYNCDSNKAKIDYTLQGNAPYNIAYTQNGQANTYTTSQATSSQYYNNGSYVFGTVTDATGCTTTITNNANQAINYNVLSESHTAPLYDCNSNSSNITYTLTGNAPYTIYYTKDGVANTFIATTNTAIQNISNGSYNLISISDATNCEQQINNAFVVNFTPLAAAITQNYYSCDSNKYKVSFNLSGNKPFIINYLKDNINYQLITNNNIFDWYLTNGNYWISSITDNTNCSVIMNIPYPVNFTPISATLLNEYYNCDSNKILSTLNVIGNAPFTFNYSTISPIPSTNNLVTTNNLNTISFSNGTHIINTLSDLTGCVISLNHIVVNNYIQLTSQITSKSHICDSNKVKVEMYHTGASPWKIYIRNIDFGNSYLHISSTNMDEIYLPTGNYVIDSIKDLNCKISKNDTIIVSFPKLNAMAFQSAVSCDSQKNVVTVNVLAGKPPFIINYTINSQSFSQTIDNNVLSIYYFGNLFVGNVTDSVGCEVLINNIFTSNYMPFIYNGYTTSYSCLKDSTALIIDVTHQIPVFLYYQNAALIIDSFEINNNKSIFVNNGLYNLFFLKDSVGCIEMLDIPIEINNNPVNFVLDSVKTNCELAKFEYSITLQGKSPWEMYYNRNNIFDSVTINTSNYKWALPSGNYYIVSIKDSNLCEKQILWTDTLKDFNTITPVLTTDKKYLTATKTNYTYLWYKDGIAIDTTVDSKILSRGNGNYQVILKDSNGCLYPSINMILDYPETVNVFPNPMQNFTTIVVNTRLPQRWDYSIIDVWGNRVLYGEEENQTKLLDIRFLAKGVYTLIVNTKLDNQKYITKLVKD